MYHAVMTADVAVVGAGPAGAWAACLLARQGARVLLIDSSHPREKPCGGGVTGRALDLVASVLNSRELPAIRIQRARFSVEDVPSVAQVSLDLNALVVVSRTDFDGLLLSAARQAGADLLRARATDLRPSPDGFEIRTTAGVVRTGFLIGADGSNSLVRRRLGQPFRRDQLSIATGFFAHGVSSEDICVELLKEPAGYLWSFPRPTHLAIGICAQADCGATSAVLRQMAARWIARAGLAEGARLEQYSWPIPSLPARDFIRLTPSGPRFCLVGDAAGLVDPITREGIYFALLSAQWAAEAVAASDAPRRYARRVRAGIGAELARAARLKAAFFRPRFERLIVEALSRSEAIRAVMQDLVAGRQDYSGLKWRLLRTLELGLAVQLFLAQPIDDADRAGHLARPDRVQ
jgi:geranylgeranyl reductase family protein